MAHLLLIEDASEVVTVVRILCRRAGHTLSCDVDGASLPSSRPDLLLLDLNLAAEDGIELYRRLTRPGGPLTGVPAALFTQGAAPCRVAAALDAGIDFLVSKELLGRPDDWNCRIHEVLELAAAPLGQAVPDGSRVQAQADLRGSGAALAHALRHPVLLRLGDEVIAAMVRRVLGRLAAAHLLPNSAVDVAVSYVNLAADLTHLASSQPDAVAPLLHGLARQVEGLLGREASAPFRDALTAALS